jgi:hypothetical protein
MPSNEAPERRLEFGGKRPAFQDAASSAHRFVRDRAWNEQAWLDFVEQNELGHAQSFRWRKGWTGTEDFGE